MPSGPKLHSSTKRVASSVSVPMEQLQRADPHRMPDQGTDRGPSQGSLQVRPLVSRVLSVVGVDPSATGTGLVALEIGTGDIVANIRITPKSVGVDRLLFIGEEVKQFFMALTRCWNVAHVCVEGYAMGYGAKGAASQSHKLGEVGGAIKTAIRAVAPFPECYPTIVAPTALKKFVMGSGNSKKEQIRLGVYKKWGVEFKTNDEVDAYALARMAQCITVGATTLKYEEEVMAKLQPFTEAPDRYAAMDQALKP